MDGKNHKGMNILKYHGRHYGMPLGILIAGCWEVSVILAYRPDQSHDKPTGRERGKRPQISNTGFMCLPGKHLLMSHPNQ